MSSIGNRTSYNIMNVREIIDTAFGSLDENTVNFKLIQMVLFLLASQLRILERRVQVELPFDYVESSSSLQVSEIKIHTQKRKQPKIRPKAKVSKTPESAAPSPSLKSKTKSYESKKSSTDKSSIDKSTTEKSSTDKTSSDKTSSDKTSADKISTDKTSTDKTSTDKSSKDKSSADKTITDKSPMNKSSSHKNYMDHASTDKSSLDMYSMDEARKDKSSTEKTSKYKTSVRSPSGNTSIGRRVDKRQLADNLSILEDLVDDTEKVLRVIHQRADSYEQPVESPTPMASLESVETQHEKLLVVERISSSSKDSKSRSKDATKISVVTQEEFHKLAEVVTELQERFEPVGSAKFPENAKLMAELRKTASLTDAMAALQLSARLEAAEKALGHMIAIITEVVSNTPGIELNDETKLVLEGRAELLKSGGIDGSKQKQTKKLDTGSMKTLQLSKSEVLEDTTKVHAFVENADSEEGRVDYITNKDLDSLNMDRTNEIIDKGLYILQTHQVVSTAGIDVSDNAAIKDVCGEMIKKLENITSENTATTTKAFKIATNLERKMDSALKACPRMTDLENLVASYADQINVMDAGLSSQMTNYQEQLTQMQHELEIGLDTMAESLANIGGDTVAVTELNNHFIYLQTDFENMGYRQRDLQDTQATLKADLKSLWQQIEMLRDTKSDRDEVVDALRDKAGIADLNGLISLEQFNAVRGDFEKRIVASYQKFNNQEIVWQKAIDDLLRELSEKADLVQVLCLKEEINKYLQALNTRIKVISDIVGDPKSAAVSKKLFRDTSCLCCSTPADMDLEKPATIPALPKLSDMKKPTDVGENKTSAIGDGDYKKCYAGLAIPHQRDPRFPTETGVTRITTQRVDR